MIKSTPPPTDITSFKSLSAPYLSIKAPQSPQSSVNMDDIEPLTNLRSMEEVKPELQLERRKSHRESIDFSIFNDSEHCEVNLVWLEFGAPRIKKCDFLNRLITGLKYYMNLDIDRNDIDYVG